MRSGEEINAEIKALEAIKPSVLRSSAFGDDHHAAIDAQLRVLREKMSDDRISNFFGDDDSHYEYDSAMDARRWLDGEYEGGASLAESWKELVR